MTRFVNLTPHVVRVYLGHSPDAMHDVRNPRLWLELPISGQIAHIQMGADNVNEGGIRLRRHRIGRITGLPDPMHGVIYVVSSLVGREAVRDDCASPDTKTAAIYDANNDLYAVRRLQQWTRQD